MALAAIVVAVFAAHALRENGGTAAPPLDDAFIHFQYARSIAEGRPFVYHPGAPPSSGASSVLYALLLAVPYALGATGLHLLWVAWVLGAFALACAYVAGGALAERVADERWAALPGALAVAAWGAFAWHAASAMETALVGAVTLGVGVAVGAWAARDAARRSSACGVTLALVAVALPFLRPEAAPFGLALSAALVFRPALGEQRWRLLGLAGPIGVAAYPLFWWALTGRATTNGALTKWLPRMPYVDAQVFERRVGENLSLAYHWLSGTGDAVSRGYFTPWVVLVGVVVGALWAVVRRGAVPRWARLLVLGAALASFGGLMTFNTFSQHRFRYASPYVLTLLVFGAAGLFDLARCLGSRFTTRLGSRPVAAVFACAWALGLAPSFSPAFVHFAHACGDIIGEHYAMAAKLRDLPSDALVAINDAGALTYLGERRTVDVMGLTTNYTGPYFMNGPGSTFEMFDSRPPDERPTHFAIYRRWWTAPSVLGAEVASITLPRPGVIVGDRTMTLYEARFPNPPGADRPAHPEALGRLLDEVDVADVESEAAHGYTVPGTTYADDIHRAYRLDGVGVVHEGGRIVRKVEAMTLRGAPGMPLVLVLRTDAWFACELRFAVDGVEVARLDVPETRRWAEPRVTVPGGFVREHNRIRVSRAPGCPDLASFHWWAYEGR